MYKSVFEYASSVLCEMLFSTLDELWFLISRGMSGAGLVILIPAIIIGFLVYNNTHHHFHPPVHHQH